MKFIIGSLTAGLMCCTGCSAVNTSAFQVRIAATTYPPPGLNHAAQREKNLDDAIERAVEDQEALDSVYYMYGFPLQ